jgi:hypothetical protein
MHGKITRVAVTYTVDTPGGPRHTFHGLAHMRRHIRSERLGELLDDLTVICEDLLAVREPKPDDGLAVARERRAAMTSEEATDLLRLQGLWRDAYAITLSDGVWAARRHDAPTALLTADTAMDLGGLMQADHARRPGPKRTGSWPAGGTAATPPPAGGSASATSPTPKCPGPT